MSQTIREWMHKNASQFDSVAELVQAAITQLNARKSGKLYTMAKEAMLDIPQSKQAKHKPSAVKRRTFEQLQQTHDLAYQVPKAIAAIAAEYLQDGGWLTDAEMITEVCVRVPRARSRWSQYRDREEYAKFQAHTPEGKLIWIDPNYRERAERMRAN